MRAPTPQVVAIRRFNRFWTRRIGVLADGDFSLTETRLLYELAYSDTATAAELGRELGLDSGYLSRLLRGLDRRGLLARSPDAADARKTRLSLTEAGHAAFAPLEAAANAQIATLLSTLPAAAADEVVRALRRVEIACGAATPKSWLLRGLQPGDLGWVIARHGAIYAQEFGWDATFEHLVAQIAAEVMQRFDPSCEAAWIAELDGVPVGAVFLVRLDDDVAKLRLLIVDPAARGLGIGARLVAECTRFARGAGYRRITLWTHEILTAARKLYAAEGYRLMGSEPMQAFGQSLTSETWELQIPPA
jgi:DNA-binding MarR family transcriptional regulator/N-acetylglutamate synthase-like GNAT family acetyltransferase